MFQKDETSHYHRRHLRYRKGSCPTPPVRRMADRHSGKTPVSSRRVPANRTGTDKKFKSLDVTQEYSAGKLDALIHQLGGMDLFCSVPHRFQNMELNMEIELNTARTNVEGFTRMVDTAFSYFRNNGGGHLAVISSIAGTKGLGVAPAYSATKRFQNTYIDALEQLSHLTKVRHSLYRYSSGICSHRLAE